MNSIKIILTEYIGKEPEDLPMCDFDTYNFKGKFCGYNFLIIFTVIQPILAAKTENEISILHKVLDVKLSGSDKELKKIEDYMKAEKQSQISNIIPKVSIDAIFKVSPLPPKTVAEEISKQKTKPLSFEEALKIENINPGDYTDPDNSDEEFV